jgi:hypothetical protein
MEQQPANIARLLTYSGDRPGRDPEWDEAEYDYYEFVGR